MSKCDRPPKATDVAKDLPRRVQRLEADKANLEDRVKSLRQQVSSPYSPSKTPDNCPGVRGVKTAGSGRKPQDLSGVLLGEYGLETC
jgi:hypothetical protein